MGQAEQTFFETYLRQAGGNAESALFAVLAEINESAIRLREARESEGGSCGASSAKECPHAEESAQMAVKKVFAILGVDIDDPARVEEFRMDLRFGRTLRRAADRGVMAVIALVCVAAAGAMWVGITSNVRGH